MVTANISNHKKYNFKMSLQNSLHFNKVNGDHDDNYSLLAEKFTSIIEVLKYFGDDKTAQSILGSFVDNIEYYATNFHVPDGYYERLGDFRRWQRDHYASIDRGIELAYDMLQTVKDNGPCHHKGCCE